LADRLIALGWGNVAAEGERIAREVARLRVDEIIGAPAGYEDGWNAATLAVLAIVPADR
jgi:hypothetical protein